MIEPMNQYIVCKTDLDQKSKHLIPGTDIELLMQNQYNDNMRERNPNIAEVVYVGKPGRVITSSYNHKENVVDLQPGDIVCVQHFQLMDHEGNSLHKIVEDGVNLYFVDFNEIYFKFVNGEPLMLPGYLLLKRIPDTREKSELDINGDTFDEHRAEILYKASDVRDYNVGDKIIHMPYADYEVIVNGENLIKMREDEIFMSYYE